MHAPELSVWSASVRDVVNAIGDAGSTRPGWMPTQVQVQVKYTCTEVCVEQFAAKGKSIYRSHGTCDYRAYKNAYYAGEILRARSMRK